MSYREGWVFSCSLCGGLCPTSRGSTLRAGSCNAVVFDIRPPLQIGLFAGRKPCSLTVTRRHLPYRCNHQVRLIQMNPMAALGCDQVLALLR